MSPDLGHEKIGFVHFYRYVNIKDPLDINTFDTGYLYNL